MTYTRSELLSAIVVLAGLFFWLVWSRRAKLTRWLAAAAILALVGTATIAAFGMPSI